MKDLHKSILVSFLISLVVGMFLLAAAAINEILRLNLLPPGLEPVAHLFVVLAIIFMIGSGIATIVLSIYLRSEK